VTGTHYRFKADVANTGTTPSINFNGQGTKTMVKATGGVTTALAVNDLRAGQWVDLVYDGTNMQVQSTLGNAAAGGASASSIQSGSLMTLTETSSSSSTYTFTGAPTLTADPSGANQLPA
jgi:hypothetical protein